MVWAEEKYCHRIEAFDSLLMADFNRLDGAGGFKVQKIY
jgi:hypothetical protein